LSHNWSLRRYVVVSTKKHEETDRKSMRPGAMLPQHIATS
jgi:hypothetical protein